MAVLKQELNYSTYQNKLLNVLSSLEESFKSSLDVSKDISHNLDSTARSLKLAEKSLSSMVHLSSRMDEALTALTVGFVPTFEHSMKTVDDSVKRFSLYLDSGSDALDKNIKSVNSNTKAVDGSTEAQDRFRRQQHEAEEDMRTFNKGLQIASDFFMKIGSHANEYSQISNNLIYISGMQGQFVKEFRNDMMGVVAQLNTETGSYYNPQQAYAQIAATMQGVTGNLEAMQEMARPVLLASETLDVNISSIASMFNRFYTRYNFSTMSMESMIGDIRKYSAGSAATGEDIVAAQESLKVMMEYYAQGDEQKLVDFNEQIAKMVGFYENSGFDPNTFLVDLLKEIEGGEFLSGDSATAIAMQRGGMSVEEVIAASNNPLNYDELASVYMKGRAEIFKDLEKSANRDYVLSSTYGFDPEQSMDIFNFVNRIGDLDAAFEEYVGTRDDTSLTELVEDKYVSATDQINNWLEQIYARLANWQESWGVGFTDIASLLATIASTIVTIKALNTLGGLGGALGSFGRGGRSTLSSLFGSTSTVSSAPAGTLAAGKLSTIAGGLSVGSTLGLGAGALLAVDGVSGIFDSDADMLSKTLSTAQATAGVVGAAGLLGVGAAAGPAAPFVLAAGGAAYLAKAIYENATALSGNATAVENELTQLGESLKSENKDRLNAISTLSYEFNKETDLEEQRNLMLKSGLFEEEELAGKSRAQLESLIDSYKSAVSAMDEVTEGALAVANKYYTNQQDVQQDDFLKDLKKANLSGSERKDIVSLLQTGVSDEDVQSKISKALKDDKISTRELKKILSKSKDAALDVGTMQSIAGYLDWDTDYTTTDNMNKIVELYQELAVAYSSKDDKRLKTLWETVVESGLSSEMKEVYGNQLEAMDISGYAEGTNYITKNQLALVHEGEAITPKKYNPAANMNELESLRELAKDRENPSSRQMTESLREAATLLYEIKEFLTEWKSDNIRRETTAESRNKFSRQRAYVNGYL